MVKVGSGCFSQFLQGICGNTMANRYVLLQMRQHGFGVGCIELRTQPAPAALDTTFDASIDIHVAIIAEAADRHQVFMLSKKSALFLADLSLSSRNSIASTVPMGDRMRRST